MNVITVEKLTSKYHHDLDWDLKKNEIHGIIGQSGEGKSCFLKILLGLFPYYSGKILNQNGGNWHHLDESVGMQFQNNALLNNLTVGENIIMPLVMKCNMDPKYANIIAKKCMQQVGLSKDVYNYFPLECSGGMQKRAALARALVLKPKILMLDEATTGLDCQLLEIYDLLLQSLEGVSIVMVTHDISRLVKIAQRISMLIGKKFYTGTFNELKNHSDERVKEFLASYARTSVI